MHIQFLPPPPPPLVGQLLTLYFPQVPYQRLGTTDFECRFWPPKMVYLVAMLCKFFEGICLKNTKTIGNVRMSIGFAGKTVRANKVSGNEGMSIFSINGFGVPKICTDPSGKSQTILPARAIWLWLCSLPCVYFGEGILLERKKEIFFRTTFRKKNIRA